MKLNSVYDTTLLRQGITYQIDGYLYKFIGADPYASLQSPQFRFRPLSGQRRRADLTLNQKQLKSRCYEVEGLQTSRTASASPDGVQLGLF